MIINILKSLFSIAWNLLKLPIAILLLVISIFLILCAIWTLYYRFVIKIERREGEHYKVKRGNLLKKLLYEVPKQFAKDRLNKDPEDFIPFGIIVFTGRQGAGKTMSLIEYTRHLQTEYPKCKVIGNLDYKFQDEELKDADKITEYKNDKKGVIIQIDEIQNWFNSKQSKNMSPEMLKAVTTNRKQRRCVLATCQNFYMTAKDIRTQTTEIRNCITLFGCWTIVHRIEPQFNEEGEIIKKKSLGWYSFVQNEEIRNAYDTYKMIDILGKDGMKERSEQYRAFENSKTKIEIDKKALKEIKK